MMLGKWPLKHLLLHLVSHNNINKPKNSRLLEGNGNFCIVIRYELWYFLCNYEISLLSCLFLANWMEGL